MEYKILRKVSLAFLCLIFFLSNSNKAFSQFSMITCGSSCPSNLVGKVTFSHIGAGHSDLSTGRVYSGIASENFYITDPASFIYNTGTDYNIPVGFGASIALVTLSSTPVGATYAWTSAATNVSGNTALGAGDIPAELLTATTTGITYSWSGNGGTGSSPNFNLPTALTGSGDITVTGQATNYCLRTQKIPFTVTNLELIATAWQVDVCKDASTSFTVDTTGTGTLAGGSLEVVWEQKPLYSPTWTIIPNGPNPLVYNTPNLTESTDYRVTLRTKDASNNILSEKTHTHSVNVIDLAMGPKTIYTICEGASVSLEGQTDGGTEWQWEDESRNVVLAWSTDVTNKRLLNQTPLNNTVYYFVARKGACIAEQIDSVYVKEFIDFTTNPSSVLACKGDIVNIVPTSTLPATGVSYSWSLDNGVAINTNTYTLPTGTAKNGTINVTPSATGYCAKTVAIPYSVTELVITPDNWPTTFCPDDDITLSMNVNQIVGTLPTTMEWYENGTAQGVNSISNTFSPTGTSTYIFEVSTAVCSETYSQEIEEVNVNIEVEESTYLSCPGDEITLTAVTDATGSYNIIWTKLGDSDLIPSAVGSGLSINVKPTERTVYTVQISNKDCTNTAETVSEMLPVPEVFDVTELGIKEFQIMVTGGTPTYLYSVDDEDNYLDNEGYFNDINYRIGKHIAYVIDANGCKTSYDFVINELPLEFPPYFTPNGDGINDTWEIGNFEQFPYSAKVYIVDRFGKMLKKFWGSDIGGWDGTYLGREMPSDDYWYIVNVGEIGKKYVGHFTLIR